MISIDWSCCLVFAICLIVIAYYFAPTNVVAVVVTVVIVAFDISPHIISISYNNYCCNLCITTVFICTTIITVRNDKKMITVLLWFHYHWIDEPFPSERFLFPWKFTLFYPLLSHYHCQCLPSFLLNCFLLIFKD